MPNPAITHFVFVDLENVPSVDLAPLAGHPVKVTLLVGNKQPKLSPKLVEQITQLSFEVRLIKVGITRKNALDLALAFHLGETAAHFPHACFHVISGDKKDFDPLVTHLRENQVEISRQNDVEALSFLTPPKKSTPRKPVAAPKPASTKLVDDRLEKLIGRLKSNPAPRPKKKSSLLARINTDFGNKLDEAAQQGVVDELIARRFLAIEPGDKVRYL